MTDFAFSCRPAPSPAGPSIRDRIASVLRNAGMVAGLRPGHYYVAHLEDVAAIAHLELRDAHAFMAAHASDGPLFCGEGVVATYDAELASVVVHRLALH